MGSHFSCPPWLLPIAFARTRCAALHICIQSCVTMGCQWDFRPCGEGFILESVHSGGSFVTVRDLKGLHQRGSAQVVAAALPTCWDVEVLPVGPTDSEPGDVFAR